MLGYAREHAADDGKEEARDVAGEDLQRSEESPEKRGLVGRSDWGVSTGGAPPSLLFSRSPFLLSYFLPLPLSPAPFFVHQCCSSVSSPAHLDQSPALLLGNPGLGLNGIWLVWWLERGAAMASGLEIVWWVFCDRLLGLGLSSAGRLFAAVVWTWGRASRKATGGLHRSFSCKLFIVTLHVIDRKELEVYAQLILVRPVKDNGQVVLKHSLTGHQKPVLTVSWSSDDCQLLTCGLEEVIRRWDVSSGECLYVYERPGVGLVSCGWFPDGKGIVSGMTDKSICLWDLDGRELECWKGQRTVNISDMAITDDGKRIISICKETAILLLDREAKFERLIEEEQVITSFSLSKDNKFLLVTLINQEIHLWSIEEEVKLVSKYKGHKRTRFVIRSCFGGFEQAFIASGSEDSQVYIWHRGTGELLSALPGHSGAVNCVSWNPINPHMLASASDDHTIRIWGLNDLKSVATHSNGFSHQSNGRI
ncbi:hypothetical protein RHGRI_037402 [Rhododendron griersonianum]|uniref:Uncharacterized protein n=1 Tax=Rhododendron griersonianum TaxID=479676 RepID=A0AAV6HRL3_9ERIC|nr:hypothetical protein RHGRI_037402 [Rhododendron griersonianum]